jgi:DNA-binding MarR family transcriptional regulator
MSSGTSQHEYLSEMEFRAWHGSLSFANGAMAALDAALRQAHGISLSEFDVLITLYNAPHRRLRMSELTQRVLITASGMTQLVTRLERGGLVSRTVDEADRRSFFATMTEAGNDRLREARPTHNEVVRERLVRRLSREQLTELGNLWDVVGALPKR